MADQIEMSTANTPANAPAQNIFRTNINFMGKPIPVNTILTFNTSQPKNNNAGTDLPVKVNSSWTPFNTSMAMAKDRENTFISWPKQNCSETYGDGIIRILLHRLWRRCSMFLLRD